MSRFRQPSILPGFGLTLGFTTFFLSAIVLIVALGAVLALVIDLDQPDAGFVQVSQQPLIDLQQQIGPPS